MYLCRYGVAAVIEDVDLSGFDVIYCAANDDASFFRLAYVALRVLPEGVYASWRWENAVEKLQISERMIISLMTVVLSRTQPLHSPYRIAYDIIQLESSNIRLLFQFRPVGKIRYSITYRSQFKWAGGKGPHLTWKHISYTCSAWMYGGLNTKQIQ